jgi:hypothetical protein
MSEVDRVRSIQNPYSPAHQAPKISDHDRRQKRHTPSDRVELHSQEDEVLEESVIDDEVAARQDGHLDIEA